MQPLDYVILFFGSFFSIGLLGIQSKNVQASRYVAAGVTSFLISLANAIFVHYVASAGSYAALLVAAVGASCGIMSSIWFYDNVLKHRLKTPVKKNHIAAHTVDLRVNVDLTDIDDKIVELKRLMDVVDNANHRYQ